MALGEKLKFLRKKLGITQVELAERTGIHLVTIKRYETDVVKPRWEQIKRLATALGVNPYTLKGRLVRDVSITTDSDYVCLLVELYKGGSLTISGERGKDNKLIKETVTMELKHLSLPVPTNDLILGKILLWEQANYLYQNAVEKGCNEAVIKAFEDARTFIEFSL